jgi:ubiquinone/menaquinone biosynthesis C-methylase UbiE
MVNDMTEVFEQSMTDISDWNRVADTYTQMVGVPDDRIYRQFEAVLWEGLGDLRGAEVLDVGCGHGWLSNAMHEAGARVWGVDGSAELLHRARTTYPDIEFTECNLTHGLPETERRFDRVIAHMVLMDIPEIGPLISAVRQVLKPQGRFIFTITHPCFFYHKTRRDEKTGELFKGVTGYLRPEIWRVDTFGGHNHYHRSLTYYFEHLRQHQMAVTRLYEPEPIPSPNPPEVQAFWRNISVFILIEAVVLSN